MRGARGAALMASVPARFTAPAARQTTVMKSNVASSYAGALCETAVSGSKLEDVHQDMDTLSGYLSANPAVVDFLTNPTIAEGKKADIIESLGKEAGFNAYTVNFLKLLNTKGRMGTIEDVIEEFEELYCGATDTQTATLVSAYMLEKEQLALIAKKIEELTGAKNIKLKREVDESLLGGFVVTYGKDGSGLIDMSVKGALDKITSEMKEVSV